MDSGACRGNKRVSDPRNESYNFPVWVLDTKLGYSARAVCPIQQRASLQPQEDHPGVKGTPVAVLPC